MTKTHICAMVALSMALLGCHRGETHTSFSVDGAKVTTNSDSGSIHYEKGDVNASMGGTTSVTEAELTLPFYPGSVEVKGSGFKVETPTERDYMSVRTSEDDPQKIADFYAEKAKDLKFSKIEQNGEITHFAARTNKDGAKLAITIVRKKGATQTEITVGSGWQKKP